MSFTQPPPLSLALCLSSVNLDLATWSCQCWMDGVGQCTQLSLPPFCLSWNNSLMSWRQTLWNHSSQHQLGGYSTNYTVSPSLPKGNTIRALWNVVFLDSCFINHNPIWTLETRISLCPIGDLIHRIQHRNAETIPRELWVEHVMAEHLVLLEVFPKKLRGYIWSFCQSVNHCPSKNRHSVTQQSKLVEIVNTFLQNKQMTKLLQLCH